MSYQHLTGYLYQDGSAKTVNFIRGTSIRIQAKGSGSYTVMGQLGDGTPQPITLIDTAGYAISASGSNEHIYIADITGLTNLTVQNVDSGISEIYFDFSDYS